MYTELYAPIVIDDDSDDVDGGDDENKDPSYVPLPQDTESHTE